MIASMNITLEECKSILENNGYIVARKSDKINEKELKTLKNILSETSHTSNSYGKNAFEIDMNKTFEQNMINLLEKVSENSYESGEDNMRDFYDNDY
jgi:hypothetical protein